MILRKILILFVHTLLSLLVFAQNNPQNFKPEMFGGLMWRSIGPAVTSGRISDFAVNPNNSSEYYVASSSGGVWKTVNRGTSFTPIFDSQGSYSIGCVSLDPNNSSTVWVGTGENNNQRSVAYGDGVYKSEDGGKTWKNMGLKNSEHIANIIVDPKNSQTIYVAAYGPVWSEGGERGVYKSTDGGITWTNIKSVSPYTGCNNLIMDPQNPQVLYAAFHQRMRKVFTYIGGGPESALFKTTDGGASWSKLGGGLPATGDIGRIGIDVSPVNPSYVYAVVEAKDNNGGIYKSTDKGQSWTKQSGTFTSGNYYQELDCDPHDANKIYITDTYYKVSYDGGKTVSNLGEINKHIDNHCIWVDPKDPKHLLVGCDGGVYETYDHAATWDFKSNLPVTQFYKVSTDNLFPFYRVHGGTQDNFSLAGPSRTTSSNGIANSDWFVTSVGDGFETQVDPKNPDIIYAQSQYGGLMRFDKTSGEYLFIKPLESENEAPYRWNWDAPLFISSHKEGRLYFGSNKLHRTDDRGNTWKVISPDLSRQIDRNKIEVMGKIWSVDAIAKNGSTDIYGQTTSIAESALDENILWVGTDDGLLHLSTDGGSSWTKFDNLPGVPNQSYVHQVIASLHDKLTAFVCFNHHRYGDFKPYVLKTQDGGKTWKSICGDLPVRGSVYTIAEDQVDPQLLFVGTEFGCFFTKNGGQNWMQLKNGLPTVAVRDIEIQRRENDLVIASFGRGFYILDDISVLRNVKIADLKEEAKIFPIKDAWIYVERMELGLRGKGHQGSSYFMTPNPKPAAQIYYYIKDDFKSYKDKRKESEKAKDEKKEKYFYPSWDSLRKEETQEDAYLIFKIKNKNGEVVRTLTSPVASGIQKISWDFRTANPGPVEGRFVPQADQLFSEEETGHLVPPGTYTISISKFENGKVVDLVAPVSFNCKLLPQGHMQSKDPELNSDYYQKVVKLRKALGSTEGILADIKKRVTQCKTSALEMKQNPGPVLEKLSTLDTKLATLDLSLYGDRIKASKEVEVPTSVSERIGTMEYATWSVTSEVPQFYKDCYSTAYGQMKSVITDLRIIDEDLKAVERLMDQNGASPTSGRWPELD
ncbi:MAG: glycosyl hydrolase [Saprospiraceae bacterium]|nr:glycosyl hydrolase [Saprospiraceae bacterium]MBK7795229.1 glycosyl hydrolase [Saprospiraceae bacterium]MBL0261882.1 glycosyl hydrolase [Saprospiraceae bacterium]